MSIFRGNVYYEGKTEEFEVVAAKHRGAQVTACLCLLTLSPCSVPARVAAAPAAAAQGEARGGHSHQEQRQPPAQPLQPPHAVAQSVIGVLL